MLEHVYYIGMISSILLAITPFFQVVTTIRMKSAKDLSTYFMMAQIIASIGFTIYGVLINEIWIIIANTSLVLANVILIVLKYYFDPCVCCLKKPYERPNDDDLQK